MKNQSQYIEQLEQTIGKFIEPVKGIPFHIAIKAVFGQKVLEPDLENKKDKELIADLSKIANIAGRNAKRDGIFRSRPNEVGNDMEPYVGKALREIGITADIPERSDGKKQAVGYPDIYFKDRFGRHVYLECKTYNKKNIGTTFRAFYFSPPLERNKSKIIYDAYHLMVAYEIEEARREGKRYYIPVAWKVVSLYSTRIDVKHEFNANNKDLL
jgi:hypothetical protein